MFTIRPPRRLEHRAGHGLGRVERPEEVRLEHLPPRLELMRMIRSSRVIPALLTRMSMLLERPGHASTTRLCGVRIGHVAPGRQRPRRPWPRSRPTVVRGGIGVAPVADRDVGALARQSQRDGPPEPARAAGDEGALAGQIDHRSCCLGVRACSGSPGTTSSSGTRRPVRVSRPSRPRRAGSGRPSSSRAAAEHGDSGSHRLVDAGERLGSAVHSRATAPDVKPAPKATITTLSPTARGPRRRPRRGPCGPTRPRCCRTDPG